MTTPDLLRPAGRLPASARPALCAVAVATFHFLNFGVLLAASAQAQEGAADSSSSEWRSEAPEAVASPTATAPVDPTVTPATAVPAATPTPASGPSVVELKAAAFDAQETARQAEAAAATAAAAAEAARRAVFDAGGLPAATDPAASAELRRATEAAKNAAAAAREATAALEEQVREHEARYSRNGFFLNGGVFYAPEFFDTSLSASDSHGFYGALGYHFGERIEVELRFDAIDDFELSSAPLQYYGSFDGWSGSLNARVFLMTKAFQPYFGMGLGVIDGSTRLTDANSGISYHYDDTEALFRVSGGFDFYVSETLALTADASIDMPGGELSGVNYATLGAGVKLRF